MVQRTGVHLSPDPGWPPDRWKLPVKRVGRAIRYLPSTNSTQREAMRAASDGAPDGLIVVTDYQTAGRGRGDNQWWAPPGCCLLFSWLIQSSIPWERTPWLTMAAAIAVTDGIRNAVGLETDVKWPNDVMYRGKKLGGILTETVAGNSGLEMAVVGVGINVNVEALPPEIEETATSVSLALGRNVSRAAVLKEILLALDREYASILEGVSPLPRWRARLATLGQQVEVTSGGRTISGLALDVGERGELVLRLQDGSTAEVWAGVVQELR